MCFGGTRGAATAGIGDVRERTPAILAAYPSVQWAYLFGPITRSGASHPASEIDITLEGTTAAEYFAVWRDSERALPEWVVDVQRDSSENRGPPRDAPA